MHLTCHSCQRTEKCDGIIDNDNLDLLQPIVVWYEVGDEWWIRGDLMGPECMECHSPESLYYLDRLDIRREMNLGPLRENAIKYELEEKMPADRERNMLLRLSCGIEGDKQLRFQARRVNAFILG